WLRPGPGADRGLDLRHPAHPRDEPVPAHAEAHASLTLDHSGTPCKNWAGRHPLPVVALHRLAGARSHFQRAEGPLRQAGNHRFHPKEAIAGAQPGVRDAVAFPLPRLEAAGDNRDILRRYPQLLLQAAQGGLFRLLLWMHFLGWELPAPALASIFQLLTGFDQDKLTTADDHLHDADDPARWIAFQPALAA